MIPVLVNPEEVIHYSVDADKESIPLTVYQDIHKIKFHFIDSSTGLKISGTRGQHIYLRMGFHFRH